MLAAQAVLQQAGAGFIESVIENEILNAAFTRAAPAARVHIGRLADRSTPVKHLNFTLVSRIEGFTFNPFDFDEDILRHPLTSLS
ncbi:hypothetical protein GCM10027361_28810 [Erwinia aphidicola]